MNLFKQMKVWKCVEVEKREAIFAMLTKKTQILSLQAYLINRCNCYQSSNQKEPFIIRAGYK